MTTNLEWVEKDGKFHATSHGIDYVYYGFFCSIVWEGHAKWWRPVSGTDEGRKVCQSHHNAICAAVEKAVLKTAKHFGSNMTAEQILSLP